MHKEATRYMIFVNQSMTNQMLNILEFYEWLIAIDLLWSCFQNIVNIRYGFTSAQNIRLQKYQKYSPNVVNEQRI